MEILGNEVQLDEKEKAKLKTINPNKIEKIYKMDQAEEKAIAELQANGNGHYHQLIWKFSGEIGGLRIRDGYNNMLKDIELLRTNFITDVFGVSIKTVQEYSDYNLSITDISHQSNDMKIRKLISVAAAEARKTYNPQRNPVIRMHLFMLEKNVLAVILSFIPELCQYFNRNTIMKYMLYNMTYVQNAYGEISHDANVVNETIRQRNMEYWKSEKTGLGAELTFPGEMIEEGVHVVGEYGSANKKISNDLYKKMIEFCERKDTSLRSFLLYSWATLLGTYNGEDKPMLMVVGDTGEPKAYPVKLDCSNDIDENLKGLDIKFRKASDCGYMADDDYNKIFGTKFFEHFHVQFGFVDFDKVQDDDGWMMVQGNYASNGIGLTIKYNIISTECYINYIYDSGIYIGENIEKIHEQYIEYITKFFNEEQMQVDKKSLQVINDVEKNNELRKELLINSAKIIKASGLFSVLDDKELAGLAIKCDRKNCIVDDELMRGGEIIDRIGIVASGKIEESSSGIDGMGRSLRIISPNMVIGLEALLENNVVKNTYTVASEEATIIWVPRDKVIELFNKKPDAWRNVLASVHEHLWRVERIWMME